MYFYIYLIWLAFILSGLNTCTSCSINYGHHPAPLRRTRQAGAQPTAGPAWDASCHVCFMSNDAYAVFPDDGGKSDSAERSRNRNHPTLHALHALTMNWQTWTLNSIHAHAEARIVCPDECKRVHNLPTCISNLMNCSNTQLQNALYCWEHQVQHLLLCTSGYTSSTGTNPFGTVPVHKFNISCVDGTSRFNISCCALVGTHPPHVQVHNNSPCKEGLNPLLAGARRCNISWCARVGTHRPLEQNHLVINSPCQQTMNYLFAGTRRCNISWCARVGTHPPHAQNHLKTNSTLHEWAGAEHMLHTHRIILDQFLQQTNHLFAGDAGATSPGVHGCVHLLHLHRAISNWTFEFTATTCNYQYILARFVQGIQNIRFHLKLMNFSRCHARVAMSGTPYPAGLKCGQHCTQTQYNH